MSRTFIVGSPAAPHRLTSLDLPADLDLSYSFWRYVDFSGMDLSAYNMNFMDIYDSNGSNCIVPVAIRHLESHRVDWTNAALPKESLSNMMQDMISEEIRQNLAGMKGRAKTAWATVSEHLDWRTGGDSVYLHSWMTLAGEFRSKNILTAQYLQSITDFLVPYPKLHRQMVAMMDTFNKLQGQTNIPIPAESRVPESVTPGGLDLRPYIVGALDRWATARMLEQLFPPYKFVCLWLYPTAHIQISDTGNPEDIVGNS